MLNDGVEKGIWKDQRIIKTADDIERAVALLEGFNVIAKSTEEEYVVPGLQASHRSGILSAAAFSAVQADFG